MALTLGNAYSRSQGDERQFALVVLCVPVDDLYSPSSRCEISVQKIVCLLAMLHRACLEAGEEAIRSSDKNDDEKQGALLSREVAGVTVERIHLSSYEGKMSPPSISSTAPLWLDTTSVSILTGELYVNESAGSFQTFAALSFNRSDGGLSSKHFCRFRQSLCGV